VTAGIHKEYVARVNKRLTAKDLKALAEGCALDGVFVQPVFVGLAGTDSAARDRIRIVVQQGRYREVRRLIEHCGALPCPCCLFNLSGLF
jgi:16S rRNA U516 pseudouridylate synthase RsuA-like enzyme